MPEDLTRVGYSLHASGAGSRSLPVVQPGHEPGAPPIFPKIAIVGLGLIGGSIALAARKIWPAGLVIAVDRNEVLERAMVRHAIDVAADDPVVISEADLVILAAPVAQNIALLETLPDHLSGGAVVTDVSSTKRAIVEAAKALPRHLTFIGGHPLAGAARSGLEYARADLFVDRPWLFTPASDATGAALERLYAFVSALGAQPGTIGVTEHDRLVAYISHLPQLTASALMHVVGEAAGEAGLRLSGRGLIDTTRLASSPVHVWRDVCDTNADEIGRTLDELITVLQALRRDLKSSEALERIFASANDWRERLLSQKPGKPHDHDGT